ncbi:thiol reductase thioredoxin [Georgenia yuyongxinii]
MVAPVYDEAAAQHGDVVFGQDGTDAEQSPGAQAGITAIPTPMAFRGEIFVFSQPRALPAAAPGQVLAAVEVGMDELRKQVAEQDAAASA